MLSRERIEELVQVVSVAHERHFHGVIGTPWLPYLRHFIVWIGAERSLLELVFRQPPSGHLDKGRRAREELVELVPKHERAAAEADDKDVEADDDASPEVNLEDRPSHPQAVRLPERAIEKSDLHAPARNSRRDG